MYMHDRCMLYICDMIPETSQEEPSHPSVYAHTSGSHEHLGTTKDNSISLRLSYKQGEVAFPRGSAGLKGVKGCLSVSLAHVRDMDRKPKWHGGFPTEESH